MEKWKNLLKNLWNVNLFILLFIVLLIWGMRSVGTFGWNLEDAARKDGNIPADWVMESDKSGEIAAMLFYPEGGDGTDLRFSIYINPHDMTVGYFFTYGGTDGVIEKGIHSYRADKISDSAFLSMNKVRAVRAVYGSGDEEKIADIDPNKPFALVLPSDKGIVKFYDDEGKQIEEIYNLL